MQGNVIDISLVDLHYKASTCSATRGEFLPNVAIFCPKLGMFRHKIGISASRWKFSAATVVGNFLTQDGN
jgi:hypothetical protein